MKDKYICIRESFDWIYIGDKDDELSNKEYESLIKYLSIHYSDKEVIEVKYNKIRFINYVGIIALGEVTIEILPKISLSNDISKDREMLLFMLSKCGELPIKITDTLDVNLRDCSLIDIIAKFYKNSLIKELQRGMYFEYVHEEDNLNSLKGKLLLKEHVKNNYVNKTRAFCRYDNYTEDNFLNSVFKAATLCVLKKVRNDFILNDIKRLLLFFGDVGYRHINKEQVLSFKFNRQNNRFKDSYSFAKLIILNMSMENTKGKDEGFSMLFEMNTLYEQYIGNIISMIWNDENRSTSLQDEGKYLLNNINSNRKNIKLKPDIVLNDYKEDYQIIIDTKWKVIEYNDRLNYVQGDIYQMYAYVTAYEKSKRCILLYPCVNEDITYPIWQLSPPFEDKYIEIKSVRLDNLSNTIEDLRKII